MTLPRVEDVTEQREDGSLQGGYLHGRQVAEVVVERPLFLPTPACVRQRQRNSWSCCEGWVSSSTNNTLEKGQFLHLLPVHSMSKLFTTRACVMRLGGSDQRTPTRARQSSKQKQKYLYMGYPNSINTASVSWWIILEQFSHTLFKWFRGVVAGPTTVCTWTSFLFRQCADSDMPVCKYEKRKTWDDNRQ